MHSRQQSPVRIVEFDFADKHVLVVFHLGARMNADQLSGQRVPAESFQHDADFLPDFDMRDVCFGNRDLDDHAIDRRDFEQRVANGQRNSFGPFQIAVDHQAGDWSSNFQVLAAVLLCL